MITHIMATIVGLVIIAVIIVIMVGINLLLDLLGVTEDTIIIGASALLILGILLITAWMSGIVLFEKFGIL